MASSYVSSPTGTLSPTSSGSPTKTRSARLNDRLQKARRHRQWVAQGTGASTDTADRSPKSGGGSVTSPEDRVRSKLARAGESHLRLKKSPSQSSPDQAISRSFSGSTAKSQSSNAGPQQGSMEGVDHGVEMTLSRMEQMMESPAVSAKSGDSYPVRVDNPAEVAWPDDDDGHPQNNRRWASPTPGQSTSSWNQESLAERPSGSVTKKYAPWEKRSDHPHDESPRVPMKKIWKKDAEHESSLPVRNTASPWQQPSSGKKSAPWEKPRSEEHSMSHATPDEEDTMDSQPSSSRQPPLSSPSPQTHNSQLGKKPDAKAPAKPSVGRKLAPWEKPRQELGSGPEAVREAEFQDPAQHPAEPVKSSTPAWKKTGIRAPSPDTLARKLAPWEKPKANEHSVPGQNSPGPAMHEVRRADAKAHATPVAARKLAPWEKPKVEDFPDPEPDMQIDTQSDVHSDTHGTSRSVASSSSSWQRPERGRFIPKQRPTQQDNLDSGIQRSDSWQTAGSTPNSASKWRSSTPSYEIGRQGSWQKPKSPTRPSSSWRAPPEEENPVSQNAQEDQGKPKLAPWQLEMQRRQSPAAKELVPLSNDFPRASPVPKPPGKLATPSWMKQSSSFTPKPKSLVEGQPNRQQAWKRTTTPPPPEQKRESTVARNDMSKEEFDDPPLHDVSSSPETVRDRDLDDAISETPSSTIRSSIGGALIETPNPQSVASLRASLGSKPTPPPLPGTIPVGAHKSPGDSPWLAGNRKAASRFGSPYVGGKAGHTNSEDSLPREKATIADENVSTVSTGSAAPHEYSSALAAARAALREEQSPVPTMQLRIPLSPAKSLSEMAADSVMIADYSQLVIKRSKLYEDDEEESLLSNGIARNTPSRDDLPPEFHNILPQQSDDTELEIMKQQSLESYASSTLANDHSPTSLALAADSADRRRNLRDRVEDYSFDDEDEAPMSSPVRRIRASRSQEENMGGDRKLKLMSPDRKDPSEVSVETLNKIRMMGNEIEASEAGASSSAVFGAPETFGAAGGGVEVEAPRVVDRARAIAQWNGGINDSPARGSTVELNNILDGEESPLRGTQLDNSDRELERSGGSTYSSGTRDKESPHRNTSRILRYFGAQESQEFTGEDANEWASRDPDIDHSMMRDESPSPDTVPESAPEPRRAVGFDDSGGEIDASNVGKEGFPSSTLRTPPRRPPRPPTSGARVAFLPDPDDPFHVEGSTVKTTTPSKSLKPEDVFGSFWAADDAANETIDFDGTDSSFFSSTSQDAPGLTADSPFRVVQLRRPRESPASSRERRKKEALADFERSSQRGHSLSSRSVETRAEI